MPHHKTNDGQVFGWGPTVQEIDVLAKVFTEIRHIAVLYQGLPPPMSLPYSSPRVSLIPLDPAGGSRIRDKLLILARAPRYMRRMWAELRRADVVHVRAPANVSLIGLFLLVVRKSPHARWAKYAGNWRPKRRDPLSYRLQRWMLRNGWPRAVVTVNGDWPDQPRRIVPFFNPSLYEAEIRKNQDDIVKSMSTPVTLLFAGRLDDSKGVGRAIDVSACLHREGLAHHLHVVGDGPLRAGFEERVIEAGLRSQVSFHGWISRERLNDFYRRAHFLLLPTESEGWPKVASEAMAYGTLPLLGAVSSIPQVLTMAGVGAAFEPNAVDAFGQRIVEYVADPAAWKRESKTAMEFASMFTYERYLGEVRKMFAEHLDLLLPG